MRWPAIDPDLDGLTTETLGRLVLVYDAAYKAYSDAKAAAGGK